MNILVPIKLVPDLVEELMIDSSGIALDPDWLRLKINEFDDHAVEQAILLKEGGAGQVTVIALDAEGVDDELFTAAAKGADRILKLTGNFEQPVNSHALARLLAPIIKEFQAGLILTGVQAHNDLDGPLGPLLAEYLGIPYVGYIAGVIWNDGTLLVRKEFAGGLVAEMELNMPAVIGIQAAEQPPRYVAFSKIRQAAKTVLLEERPVLDIDRSGEPIIEGMFQMEVGEKAEMISGNMDEITTRFLDILMKSGVL